MGSEKRHKQQKASTEANHPTSAPGRPQTTINSLDRQTGQLILENFAAADTLPPVQRTRAVTYIQRTYGNAAAQQVIRRQGEEEELLQTKLEVGPANDVYEREADRVAAEVMRSISSAPVRHQDEEEETVQATPSIRRLETGDDGFTVDEDTEQRLRTSRGQGHPLPDITRATMEPRFGADFGDVRVHTGAEATQLSRDLQATAFTHGSNIYFAPGSYKPGTREGDELLAHELTHVIQQTGGQAAQRKPAQIQRQSKAGMAGRVLWGMGKGLINAAFGPLSPTLWIDYNDTLNDIYDRQNADNQLIYGTGPVAERLRDLDAASAAVGTFAAVITTIAGLLAILSAVPTLSGLAPVAAIFALLATLSHIVTLVLKSILAQRLRKRLKALALDEQSRAYAVLKAKLNGTIIGAVGAGLNALAAGLTGGFAWGTNFLASTNWGDLAVAGAGVGFGQIFGTTGDVAGSGTEEYGKNLERQAKIREETLMGLNEEFDENSFESSSSETSSTEEDFISTTEDSSSTSTNIEETIELSDEMPEESVPEGPMDTSDLDEAIERMNQTLAELDTMIKRLEERLAGIEKRLNELRESMKAVTETKEKNTQLLDTSDEISEKVEEVEKNGDEVVDDVGDNIEKGAKKKSQYKETMNKLEEAGQKVGVNVNTEEVDEEPPNKDEVNLKRATTYQHIDGPIVQRGRIWDNIKKGGRKVKNWLVRRVFNIYKGISKIWKKVKTKVARAFAKITGLDKLSASLDEGLTDAQDYLPESHEAEQKAGNTMEDAVEKVSELKKTMEQTK